MPLPLPCHPLRSSGLMHHRLAEHSVRGGARCRKSLGDHQPQCAERALKARRHSATAHAMQVIVMRLILFARMSISLLHTFLLVWYCALAMLIFHTYIMLISSSCHAYIMLLTNRESQASNLQQFEALLALTNILSCGQPEQDKLAAEKYVTIVITSSELDYDTFITDRLYLLPPTVLYSTRFSLSSPLPVFHPVAAINNHKTFSI